MATSVSGNFAVASTVYHVSLSDGVREAIVRSQTIDINSMATNITYDIAYTLPTIGCTGSSDAVLEADLFDDIDLALAEYKARIQAA